ncbi:MAG: hypothetical protein ABW151_05120, partial [Pseudorhodoplanes sp.]
PLAEPEPHPVVLGTTTGEPEMLGTCGREAAFGLDGLTAPGDAGWLAAGFPVVPGGPDNPGLDTPGGLLCAEAAVATVKLTIASKVTRAVFHMGLRSLGESAATTHGAPGRSSLMPGPVLIGAGNEGPMDQPQADEESAQYPRYAYKPSLMGAPWELQLTPDALVWSLGSMSGRVPYGSIRRIRLGFRPVTMQSYRFIAEIWPERGSKIPVSSASWKSLVEQERQDGAYVGFITDLHRRIAAARGTPRLDAGSVAFLYWPGLAIFVAISLAVVVLMVRALQQGEGAASLFLFGFFLLVLWQLGSFFKRNLPRRYTLDRIPPDVLPKT